MITRKDRRGSGRVSEDLTIPRKLAKEEMLDAEVYTTHWSDWDDHRDGWRHCSDKTLKRNGGHKKFTRKNRA